MTLHPNATDITGRRSGKLVALYPTDERRDNKVLWMCRCDCGGQILVNSPLFVQQQVRSCGCLRSEVMRQLKVGEKFGLLTVTGYAGKSHWFCACECGQTSRAMASNLRSGKIKSCGCKQAPRTHGLSRSKMYKRWYAMISRCHNPKHQSFADYGGRGIRVCHEWHDFMVFYAAVGDPPLGLTLDRIDVNKGYEPGNVRWATQSTQMSNLRSRKQVALDRLSIDELESVLAAKKQGALGVFG